MNIALFCGVYFPQPGGAQVQVHNLANKLIEKGHNVDVFILNKTNINNNLYNLIIINRFILSSFYYLNYFFKIDLSFLFMIYMKSIFKKKKYDVFHFQFLNFKTLYILKLLKKTKTKILTTFHGIDIQINKKINYGYRLNKNYEKLFFECLKNIDIFFYISKTIKKDLLEAKIKRNKIYFLPNAIETYKFNIYPKNNIEAITKKIKLITVARFAEKKKGLDLIPKIAEHLFNKNVNFEWYLVGHNSKNLKNLPNMSKYSKHFKYFENIENLNEDYCPHSSLIKIYKECHLYINLARIESFGVTLIEALASSLPIITFNTKGGNELVIDGYNGHVIKDYSSDNMANAIISFYKNEKLFNKIKLNTIKSVQKFDLNLIADNTINVYKKLNF